MALNIKALLQRIYDILELIPFLIGSKNNLFYVAYLQWSNQVLFQQILLIFKFFNLERVTIIVPDNEYL